VEICPAGVGVVEPADGWLVHTNHFLDPMLAEGERVILDVTTTFERQDVLQARVKGVREPLALESLVGVLCAHEDDGTDVCRHLDVSQPFGFRSATLATVAIDPSRRLAAISAWGPCRRTEAETLVTTA
jgi:isopenicillin-N N-acyltransferase-like protein